MDKINYFIEQNEKMKNDLKKNKYPNGAVVYVIDYGTKNEQIYRLGITTNMNMKKRKQIYNSHPQYAGILLLSLAQKQGHTFHKKNVVMIKKINNPIKLETCLRAMLYDYRYKNHKDFFICDLSIIKKAFTTCINSIKHMDKIKNNSKSQMKGGSKTINKIINHKFDFLTKKISLLKKHKQYLDNKINKINKNIYHTK